MDSPMDHEPVDPPRPKRRASRRGAQPRKNVEPDTRDPDGAPKASPAENTQAPSPDAEDAPPGEGRRPLDAAAGISAAAPAPPGLVRPAPHAPRRGQILAFPSPNRRPRPAPGPSPSDLRLIDALRELQARSRLSRPGDTAGPEDGVAGLKDADPKLRATRAAIALFHALPVACRKRPTLFPRGARSASQDEMWLLRLIQATRAGDLSNIAALCAFRVRRADRRRVLGLIRDIADGAVELARR